MITEEGTAATLELMAGPGGACAIRRHNFHKITSGRTSRVFRGRREDFQGFLLTLQTFAID